MKKVWFVLFFVYILLLLYFVVFSFQNPSPRSYLQWNREMGYWNINLYPFRGIIPYIRALPERYAMVNLFGNIIAFAPYGFLLAAIFPTLRKLWRILLVCFVTVLLIETMQFVSMYGFFDVDDILLNCIGGVLGYGIYLLCCKIPFELSSTQLTENGYTPEFEAKLLAESEELHTAVANGTAKLYKNAAELFADLDAEDVDDD